MVQILVGWQDFAALQQEPSCHMTLKREMRPQEVSSRALRMTLMQAAQSLMSCSNERELAVSGFGTDASADW